jgi:hypothetical protein
MEWQKIASPNDNTILVYVSIFRKIQLLLLMYKCKKIKSAGNFSNTTVHVEHLDPQNDDSCDCPRHFYSDGR